MIGTKRLEVKVSVMIMSGVQDGMLLNFSTENNEGRLENDQWIITIGRQEDRDICLKNDTFISRQHAQIVFQNDRWWLLDCNSKNGTYLEGIDEDFHLTERVTLTPGQLFRVGRTWMRIQTE